MPERTMHELLVGTRNTIDRRGHAKYTPIDRDGNVCLFGGFHITYGNCPDATRYDTIGGIPGRATGPVIDEFAHVLGFETAAEGVKWNNMQERTKEEVLARLDDAIARTAPSPEDLELEAPEEVTV